MPTKQSSTKPSTKKTTPTTTTKVTTNKKVVSKKESEPVQEPVQEKQVQVQEQTTETQLPSLSDDFTALFSSMASLQKQFRDLNTQFKNLQRRVNKEHRELEKASKGRRKKGGASGDKPKRAPSGFAKPTGLSPELCVFLGVEPDTEMARTAVTKQITTYVKENDLQNPENKKIIMPDNKLGKLLNVPNDETLTYFNLQKFMKVHFKKAGEA